MEMGPVEMGPLGMVQAEAKDLRVDQTVTNLPILEARDPPIMNHQRVRTVRDHLGVVVARRMDLQMGLATKRTRKVNRIQKINLPSQRWQIL